MQDFSITSSKDTKETGSISFTPSIRLTDIQPVHKINPKNKKKILHNQTNNDLSIYFIFIIKNIDSKKI